jgi:hypothetical protein
MITAKEVNQLIDRMSAARPQPGAYCSIKQIPGGYSFSPKNISQQIPHPWRTEVHFDSNSKHWVAVVEPGFVNGVDPICSVINPQNGKTISAPLTDRPSIPLVSLTDRTSGNLAGISLPIPDFFKQMGAALDRTTTIDASGNISMGENLSGWRRLLSCDLYLSVARISVNGSIQINDNPGGGSVTSLVPSFDASAISRYGTRPRLLVADNLKVQQYLSAQQQLLQTWTHGTTPTDVPEDTLVISTVFFLSPPKTDPDAVLDATWSAYTQHSLFYNVLYAAQNVAQFKAAQTPIVLYTGLAGGLGDAIANSDLATINDAANALQSGLAKISQKGTFWSI